MPGWLDLEWGRVPEYIGSVMAGTSAVVAALVYRRSVLERERDQASRVAAWVEEADEGRQKLYVANRSDASIFEIAVRVSEGDGPLALRELPAATTAEAMVKGAPVSRTFTRGLEFSPGLMSSMELHWVTELTGLPELTFRDALGRRWVRDHYGRLRRIRAVRRELSSLKAEYSLLGLLRVSLQQDKQFPSGKLDVGRRRPSDQPDGEA
ncbi:hypothetical protein ACIBKY_26660 [Nonomuraea sp. NPDC050394]|uniref:hypothetical protein n=1 Tax=Nonomuraea sp. NPDC050394 TaxID=3364363 RepID=UPI0037A832CF